MTDMYYRPQRNWGARLRDMTYLGMRLIVLENERLRLGILAGKGADIIELVHKPTDCDFVWLGPGGVTNPEHRIATAPDSRAVFRETYPGGWQEIFPHGGAPSDRIDAARGQHGEVFALPWDVTILEDTPATVAVRCAVHTRVVPCRIEKTFRLRAGEARLRIEERLTNQSHVPVTAMWGHHITFGAPFLTPGSRIRLPEAIMAIPHPIAIAPGGRRVGAGAAFPWPIDPVTGTDLATIPPAGTPSEQVYLQGFGADAWYEIRRPDDGPGCRVAWDGAQMPYAWFWQEFGASTGYPWFGRTNTIGLEPYSSLPMLGDSPHDTVMQLEPGAERSFWLEFEVLER